MKLEDGSCMRGDGQDIVLKSCICHIGIPETE